MELNQPFVLVPLFQMLVVVKQTSILVGLSQLH